MKRIIIIPAIVMGSSCYISASRSADNNAAFNLALKKYNDGNFADSHVLFEKALELNPNDALAMYYLALMDFKRYGLRKEVLKKLDDAYRADPDGEAGLQAYVLSKNIKDQVRRAQEIAVRAFDKETFKFRIDVFAETPRRRTSLFARCVAIENASKIQQFEFDKKFPVTEMIEVSKKIDGQNVNISKSVSAGEARWEIFGSEIRLILDEAMVYNYSVTPMVDDIHPIVGKGTVLISWLFDKNQYYFKEIDKIAQIASYDELPGVIEADYSFFPSPNGIRSAGCFAPNDVK